LPVTSLLQASTTTLIVGVAALVILIVLKIYAPRMPGVLVTRVKYEVMELLEKAGVDKFIRRDHIHNKVVEAVQGFIQKEIPLTKNDQ
jgi:phage host-nuclease inhibitor protein Gam